MQAPQPYIPNRLSPTPFQHIIGIFRHPVCSILIEFCFIRFHEGPAVWYLYFLGHGIQDTCRGVTGGAPGNHIQVHIYPVGLILVPPLIPQWHPAACT